ncbi:MAG TPA: hypothetical protein VE973_02875 [Candidatus Limnocylindria bacterium]|nr:hypothetical protein [Candidatus Limnocylindria bacterium]
MIQPIIPPMERILSFQEVLDIVKGQPLGPNVHPPELMLQAFAQGTLSQEGCDFIRGHFHECQSIPSCAEFIWELEGIDIPKSKWT